MGRLSRTRIFTQRLKDPSSLLKMEKLDNFSWISNQKLTTLSSPFAHGSQEELEKALESNAIAMVNASPAISLLMAAALKKKRRARCDDQKDARFQIHCKFRSWGYGSPQDMMDDMPDFVAMMNGDVALDDEEALQGEAMKKAMNYSRAIIDLQHQLLKENAAIFTSRKIDALHRKVLHVLVEANNKICNPMLPKLKTRTIDRKSYGKAIVEVSRLL